MKNSTLTFLADLLAILIIAVAAAAATYLGYTDTAIYMTIVLAVTAPITVMISLGKVMKEKMFGDLPDPSELETGGNEQETGLMEAAGEIAENLNEQQENKEDEG